MSIISLKQFLGPTVYGVYSIYNNYNNGYMDMERGNNMQLHLINLNLQHHFLSLCLLV